MDSQGFCLRHPKITRKSRNKHTGMDYTTENTDPHPRGHHKKQKVESKGRILTDPQGYCLGQPKLTIKSQNKSTGTDHNTVITDPHPHGNTKEQKYGSKTRILMDPQVFALVNQNSPQIT